MSRRVIYLQVSMLGERAAAMYSLIGSCKLKEIDPESYLRYVFEHALGMSRRSKAQQSLQLITVQRPAAGVRVAQLPGDPRTLAE